MVKDRTETLLSKSDGEDDAMRLLRERLQQGLLSILATLENYATAFEALGGMRGTWPYHAPPIVAQASNSKIDQIRDKIDLASNLA